MCVCGEPGRRRGAQGEEVERRGEGGCYREGRKMRVTTTNYFFFPPHLPNKKKKTFLSIFSFFFSFLLLSSFFFHFFFLGIKTSWFARPSDTTLNAKLTAAMPAAAVVIYNKHSSVRRAQAATRADLVGLLLITLTKAPLFSGMFFTRPPPQLHHLKKKKEKEPQFLTSFFF